MSRIREGQDLLHAASQRLDEIAPRVCDPNGDPEELGMLAQAQQLEEEAERLLAAASVAPTAEEAAALAAAAEELFRQAAAQRHQCKERLEHRHAVVSAAADATKEVQAQIVEAVEGTNHGADLITATTGIVAAIDEGRDSLAAAMSMATEREQTGDCLRLIVQAQEQGIAVMEQCQRLQRDIDFYVAQL